MINKFSEKRRCNYKRTMKVKYIMVLLCALSTLSIMAQGCKQAVTSKTEKKEMKTLTVYYSFTAGNTKRIAERVQQAIGGDIVRLETVKPYPSDYQEAVNQGNEEVKRGYKPALKPLGVDINDYDRIIVGTPTWWYKMAPAVLSFLSSNNLKGKIVVPFMTNAGWPGSVIEDMTDLAQKKGATVQDAHEFRFSSDEQHFDRMITSEREVNEWIERLK